MRMLVLVIAVVVIALVVMRARSRTGRRGDGAPAPADLRRAVLRRELFAGASSPAGDHPRAVLMDWGVGNGVATLAAFDDGTTSLYTSGGGGIIGAGGHETVRAAAAAFRAEGERMRAQFAPTEPNDSFPLPPTGQVVFYLVTADATLRAGPVEGKDFASGQHPLTRLGNAAQATIAAMRSVSPP